MCGDMKWGWNAERVMAVEKKQKKIQESAFRHVVGEGVEKFHPPLLATGLHPPMFLPPAPLAIIWFWNEVS